MIIFCTTDIICITNQQAYCDSESTLPCDVRAGLSSLTEVSDDRETKDGEYVVWMRSPSVRAALLPIRYRDRSQG